MPRPDRTAARANRKRMRREIAEPCPTPHLRAYLIEDTAQRIADRLGVRVFACGCGCYHLAKSTLSDYQSRQDGG